MADVQQLKWVLYFVVCSFLLLWCEVRHIEHATEVGIFFLLLVEGEARERSETKK